MWFALAGCETAKPAAPQPPAADSRVDPSLVKVDVHMHIDPSAASTALRVMAEQGIAVGLNASGGTPTRGLPESTALAASSGGRLRPYCNLELSRIVRPHFEDYIESVYEACKRAGGLGIKIPKSFGLSVFDNDGSLLRVDDPRADPIFDRAAAFGFPVLIHVGDPKAFFEPATPANERYAELQAHPNWSFSGLAPNGAPWPSWNDLLNAFERLIARHPQTKFLGAHFGNCAEEPDRVDAWLDRYPNLFIDTAARVPELGRHPADRMRAFFMKHRERVLFGSDLAVMPQGLVLGSNGRGLGREAEAADFFRAHWLYFETPIPRLRHPTPIQGNWTVDGVGLPREVLEKLYAGNALRLFNLQLPTPLREQNVARGN